MKKHYILLGYLLPKLAWANTCVDIDESRDTLTETERKSALSLVEQEFRDLGRTVGSDNCTETYTLVHARFGESVTVTIVGPEGSQKMQAAHIEELPDVYSRLIPAVVNGTTTDATMTRDTVTTEEAAPQRASADSLATITIGDGFFGGSFNMLTFGGSYRWELDSIAIDVGGNLMVDVSNGESIAGFGGLSAFYIPGKEANSSPYFGGGLGFGGGISEHIGTGVGFTPRLSVGYMFLRATTIRIFGQVDATLPVWLTDEDKWTPSISLNAGFAFKPIPRTSSTGLLFLLQ